MGGHAGKIIYIDLTSKKVQILPVQADFARKYIGGLGFSTKIFIDLIKEQPQFDALSPQNPIIVMTGPLTGIKMNAVARWSMCAKSPLTGLWGDSNAGGFFGSELKFAGYDGVVITGAAQSPSYIHIENDKVEIRDATKYWGKDTYDTTDEMVADHKGSGPKKIGQTLTIGPAGEQGVLFANVVSNKGHVAGRSGMGAVWGSKKLKAIFVKGSNKPTIAHPDRLEALRTELKEVYENNITVEGLRAFGTASHMDVGIISGDVPMKNWKIHDWDEFDEIAPIAYGEKILAGRKSCYACKVSCKRVAEVKEGPYKFAKGPGPEYETVASFGTMCLNSSMESIGKANDLCNRYGMDTITCGSTIAFAIDCFDNGLITKTETDGLELTWGNSEAIIALVEKIAKQDGFGKILAQGSAKAADLIGKTASDYLTTVKGMEAPMHDPRSAHGYGLAYAVSPRGACHMASLQYPIEGGGMYLPEFPDLADEIFWMTSDGKALLNVVSQDFGMFFSSCAIFCNLGAMVLNATQALDMINHVTGFDYTLNELLLLGRRVWYLKRGISNLFGATAENDHLPKRLMTGIADGPTEGSVPDMDHMLKEFYELRQFNPNGTPKKEVLIALELEELAELLY